MWSTRTAPVPVVSSVAPVTSSTVMSPAPVR